MLGRPALTSNSYMDENFPSILASASFIELRIGRNGWLAGTKSSSLIVENKLSLYPSVPRIAVPDLFNIAFVGRMSRFFNSLLNLDAVRLYRWHRTRRQWAPCFIDRKIDPVIEPGGRYEYQCWVVTRT